MKAPEVRLDPVGRERGRGKIPQIRRLRRRRTWRRFIARIIADCQKACYTFPWIRTAPGPACRPCRSFEPRSFGRRDRGARGPCGKNGVARKWRRNDLKRLNPRPEM